MSSSVPQLLSASGAGQPSRSASGVVAKAARGFQVFSIDGYSWTRSLPGGERITSEAFSVGGRQWFVDYYPNGADASKDSADAVAIYVRLQGNYSKKERVRAQYKFSLLDLAGTAAYELPAETGIFTCPGPDVSRHPYGGGADTDDVGCGHAAFITREDLERRCDILLKEDCLAIRCDVGVTEVVTLAVGPKPPRPMPGQMGYTGGGYDYYNGGGGEHEDSWDGSREGRRGQQAPPDDKEFIRRCLASQRRRQ